MKTFLLFWFLLMGGVVTYGEDSLHCCTPLPDDPLYYELTATPGSLTYTVNLTGDPIYYGFGTFTRNGNLLGYELRTIPDGLSVAEIRAPLGSADAQILFSLRRTGCSAPSPDPNDPGSCTFQGTMILSDSQIAELDRGAWFVRSFGPSGLRIIEGPIVQVPEPSTWSLMLAGFIVCWKYTRWLKTHSRP